MEIRNIIIFSYSTSLLPVARGSGLASSIEMGGTDEIKFLEI
jgi:hypothetical protein